MTYPCSQISNQLVCAQILERNGETFLLYLRLHALLPQNQEDSAQIGNFGFA
jgi:hypothetical protein